MRRPSRSTAATRAGEDPPIVCIAVDDSVGVVGDPGATGPARTPLGENQDGHSSRVRDPLRLPWVSLAETDARRLLGSRRDDTLRQHPIYRSPSTFWSPQNRLEGGFDFLKTRSRRGAIRRDDVPRRRWVVIGRSPDVPPERHISDGGRAVNPRWAGTGALAVLRHRPGQVTLSKVSSSLRGALRAASTAPVGRAISLGRS
jgi:hypothetical protein